MLRTVLTASAIIAFTVGTAAAQGAFDNLSPGNQKIVEALCNAQTGGCPTSSGGTTLTKDQIATMKKHKGFGEIFKEMQKNGQIPQDVKNLGQLVRGQNHPPSGTSSGTTITSASGKSQVVGKPEHANTSGKSRFDEDAGNSGRSSDSSGSGRGYGYGRGDSGVSGGMGHGGGRWK